MIPLALQETTATSTPADFLLPLLLAATAFLTAYVLVLQRNRKVTKRKDAEYMMLLEQATDAIFLFSTSGRILLANQQACILAERSLDELIGHNVCEFLEPGQADLLREALPRSRQLRIAFENSLTLLGGRSRWIEASGRVLDDDRVLVVARDQTERKKLERSNAELANHLVVRQRMESLGKLAGGVAHDFNNLMTVVLANADEATSYDGADPRLNLNLTKIVTAAQRAGELTQQLLAYSGQGSFQKALFDVNELIAELGGLLRSAIPVSVNLTWQLEPDLPAVSGDAARIRQVVMNLVLNAADAIPDSGSIVMRTKRVGAVELARGLDKVAARHDGVLIEVQDDGTGMTSEIRDQIFDPFFTTKATGRGLGLAACQGIVRGHDGSLTVESEWGDGSIFRVLLPGSAAQGSATPELDPATLGAHSGCILVVDDNPDVRDSTAAMLRRFGYEAVIAEGGEQGLAIARELGDQIDCALIDLSMPGMDGHATTKALRALLPELPVILMSGFAAEVEGTRHPGNTLSLQKPFTPDTLRERVQRSIGARSN